MPWLDNNAVSVLWLKSGAVFAAVFLIGLLFKKYFAVFTGFILNKTGLNLNPKTVSDLKNYILFWFFLIAAYAFFMIAPVNHKNALILKIFYFLFSFSAVVMIAGIVSKIFRRGDSETISVNVIKFTIIFAGAVVILNQLGIKLTPILTALGVGSLAVALALQDTLGNFFAGINIAASGHIMRGDYIHLDSGQEGTVEEINWRSISIREMSNTLISVPNTKIAASIIKRFNYRNSEVTASVKCAVSYGSDLDKVEKTAVEAAYEIIKSDSGGVKTYIPVVRFSEFADSSINFDLYFRIKDVYCRGKITHLIIKNIKKKFDEEKIDIPFPQRVVYLEKK
ncbi:MAG: mechanosensitive ion channel family protein [Endomicrobium sp.]|jgi:small-conductance mechanosensitive channel|nr:mechanosensitive ion channel family protein [Endomicrobium sp.]